MSKDTILVHELGGGAIAELLNTEMELIKANIDDPNTEATDERQLILKIKIKPDKNRKYFNYGIQVFRKEANRKSYEGTAILIHNEIIEPSLNQTDMFINKKNEKVENHGN